MKCLILSAVCALSLLGQDARVAQLSKPDAERAKAAYDAMKKAEANWQAIQTEIEHTYVSDSHQEDAPLNNGNLTLSGTGSVSTYPMIVGDSTTLIAWKDEFDCAAPGTALVKHADGAYGPQEVDLACMDKKDKARAQAELLRAKSKRDEEERRAKAPKITVYTPKDGWTNGFTFSPDFQFIVPKPAPISTTLSGTSVWADPGILVPNHCLTTNCIVTQ